MYYVTRALRLWFVLIYFNFFATNTIISTLTTQLGLASGSNQAAEKHFEKAWSTGVSPRSTQTMGAAGGDRMMMIELS
jgi:hypothetical protein